MSNKENLTKLSETDLWSLVLFTLFKMRDLPEYSSLSELVYLLPKESVIQLCQYYGGMTITIPTLDELEEMLYTLLLYKKIEIDKIDYDKALSELSLSQWEESKVKKQYEKVHRILDRYEFKSRADQ